MSIPIPSLTKPPKPGGSLSPEQQVLSGATIATNGTKRVKLIPGTEIVAQSNASVAESGINQSTLERVGKEAKAKVEVWLQDLEQLHTSIYSYINGEWIPSDKETVELGGGFALDLSELWNILITQLGDVLSNLDILFDKLDSILSIESLFNDLLTNITNPFGSFSYDLGIIQLDLGLSVTSNQLRLNPNVSINSGSATLDGIINSYLNDLIGELVLDLPFGEYLKNLDTTFSQSIITGRNPRPIVVSRRYEHFFNYLALALTIFQELSDTYATDPTNEDLITTTVQSAPSWQITVNDDIPQDLIPLIEQLGQYGLEDAPQIVTATDNYLKNNSVIDFINVAVIVSDPVVDVPTSVTLVTGRDYWTSPTPEAIADGVANVILPSDPNDRDNLTDLISMCNKAGVTYSSLSKYLFNSQELESVEALLSGIERVLGIPLPDISSWTTPSVVLNWLQTQQYSAYPALVLLDYRTLINYYLELIRLRTGINPYAYRQFVDKLAITVVTSHHIYERSYW